MPINHPWLKLSDGAWINTGNINTVREEGDGTLRVEMIGEQGSPSAQHRRVSSMADVELLKAYLAQATFTPPGDPNVRVFDHEG